VVTKLAGMTARALTKFVLVHVTATMEKKNEEKKTENYQKNHT